MDNTGGHNSAGEKKAMRLVACAGVLLAATGGASGALLRQGRGGAPEEGASRDRADAQRAREATTALLSGEDPFSADFAARSVGEAGRFWEYGTCTTSSAWHVPYFGARWPLVAGTVSWYDRIDVNVGEDDLEVGSEGSDDSSGSAGKSESDNTAYVPRSVYAVLNQAHLSIFKSRQDADMCKEPDHVIDVDTMHSAGRGGEPVLISQQNAELQSGESPSFCVHLQLANRSGPMPQTRIFCVP